MAEREPITEVRSGGETLGVHAAPFYVPSEADKLLGPSKLAFNVGAALQQESWRMGKEGRDLGHPAVFAKMRIRDVDSLHISQAMRENIQEDEQGPYYYRLIEGFGGDVVDVLGYIGWDERKVADRLKDLLRVSRRGASQVESFHIAYPQQQ